jgi:hypothetical protein
VVSQFRRALELEPHFAASHGCLSLAYMQQGRSADAVTEAHEAVKDSSRSPEPLAIRGIAYATHERHSDARGILDELVVGAAQSYTAPTFIAALPAHLGDVDRAFEWLKLAYDARSDWLPDVHVDPVFDGLRADVRLGRLLRRLRLGDAPPA